jgi:hypothetical protein
MTYDPTKFAQSIDEELAHIRETLVKKNHDYGNSALDPVGIFADPDPVQQLGVQIDHKLARIRSTKAGATTPSPICPPTRKSETRSHQKGIYLLCKETFPPALIKKLML